MARMVRLFREWLEKRRLVRNPEQISLMPKSKASKETKENAPKKSESCNLAPSS